MAEEEKERQVAAPTSTNGSVGRMEYEKRHEELMRALISLESRVDKIEDRINKLNPALDLHVEKLDAIVATKDAEAQKTYADIRREIAESYVKLLEAIHTVRDEVSKDRLATQGIEAALRGDMARTTNKQITVSNRNLRQWLWILLSLIGGSGGVEVIRVLLTGKP